MAGPRMPASGTLLAILDGHGTPLIALENEIAEEARLNMRKNIENGVNAIKGAGGVNMQGFTALTLLLSKHHK